MENQELHSFITDSFKDLYQYLGAKFVTIDNRFDETDAKFVDVDKRFDEMDAKFVDVENGFANIQNEFPKIEKRFDQQDLSNKDFISRLQEMDSNHFSEQRFELNFLSSRVDKIEKRMFKIESNQS